LRNLLVGESYLVERVAIKITSPEVPQDCSVLVINKPESDLHSQELRAIREYMARGGRLLILLDDPVKCLRDGHAGEPQLIPWLDAEFGIVVGNDLAVTDRRDSPWEVELRTDNAPFRDVEDGFLDYVGSFSKEHPITGGFDQIMLLQGTRTIGVAEEAREGTVAMELLRTTPDFWAETDIAKLAETGHAKPNEGERNGPLSIAVAAVKLVDPSGASGQARRDARVVVTGDSDLAANGGLDFAGHLNFVLDAIAWLSEQEELIAIRPSSKTDSPLVLTMLEQRTVTWVTTLMTFQAVVFVGLVVFFLRRRHQ